MPKKISVLIPTYNEEDNVIQICEAVKEEFKNKLNGYDYEIVFIDNCSKDRTREKMIKLCSDDNRVKAIFNAKNFGAFKSPFYGMLQTTGDCVIMLCADFQDPIEMIPEFISEWEKGCRIVIGIKTASKESGLMYFLRSKYYEFIKKYSDVEQIEHFTGFGLYDKTFIDVLRKLEDPMPYLRGIVAELGFERKEIEYVQPLRRAGKTSTNWYRLYDAAMLGITSYTKIGLRLATITGFIISIFNFIVGMGYLIAKLIFWDSFPMGSAPILIGMFFLGAVQILFIGLMGEYILNINTRIMKRPLVVEEKRLNF